MLLLFRLWWSGNNVLGCGLDIMAYRFDSRHGHEICLLSCFQTAFGAHSTSWAMAKEGFFSRGTVSEAWSWPCTPPSTFIKNAWSYITTPTYTFTIYVTIFVYSVLSNTQAAYRFLRHTLTDKGLVHKVWLSNSKIVNFVSILLPINVRFNFIYVVFSYVDSNLLRKEVMTSEKVKKSRYRPKVTQRFPRNQSPQITWQRHRMVIRLSALRTGRLYPPPPKCSWYSFLLEAESTPGP
jgi:hypothetical protein